MHPTSQKHPKKEDTCKKSFRQTNDYFPVSLHPLRKVLDTILAIEYLKEKLSELFNTLFCLSAFSEFIPVISASDIEDDG
jgi:hypothetical protein